jgi:hypothetical protein
VTTYRITADHALSEHGAAILDLGRGDICFLNPAAGRILEALAAGTHDTDLITGLATATGADPDIVGRDTRTLIEGLIHRGLLAATVGSAK